MRVERVVDNRVFLLGLDKQYRKAMQMSEFNELRQCAHRVAAALQVSPAAVPVEGYYSESPPLAEYFRLMRALQAVESKRIPDVESLAEFQRLRQVCTSRLYGFPEDREKLFPAMLDSLTTALERTSPQWTLATGVPMARSMAIENDDYSLVGLAALTQDAVVLTALRETVVLYAEGARGISRPVEYVYRWNVDEHLAAQAQRFVTTFNDLLGERLAPAGPEFSSFYWTEAEQLEECCVRIGSDPSGRRHYHWAIRLDRSGKLEVEEFWDTEIWTTRKYRLVER
jgi:hypothetical protein